MFWCLRARCNSHLRSSLLSSVMLPSVFLTFSFLCICCVCYLPSCECVGLIILRFAFHGLFVTSCNSLECLFSRDAKLLGIVIVLTYLSYARVCSITHAVGTSPLAPSPIPSIKSSDDILMIETVLWRS